MYRPPKCPDATSSPSLASLSAGEVPMISFSSPYSIFPFFPVMLGFSCQKVPPQLHSNLSREGRVPTWASPSVTTPLFREVIYYWTHPVFFSCPKVLITTFFRQKSPPLFRFYVTFFPLDRYHRRSFPMFLPPKIDPSPLFFSLKVPFPLLTTSNTGNGFPHPLSYSLVMAETAMELRIVPTHFRTTRFFFSLPQVPCPSL